MLAEPIMVAFNKELTRSRLVLSMSPFAEEASTTTIGRDRASNSRWARSLASSFVIDGRIEVGTIGTVDGGSLVVVVVVDVVELVVNFGVVNSLDGIISLELELELEFP